MRKWDKDHSTPCQLRYNAADGPVDHQYCSCKCHDETRRKIAEADRDACRKAMEYARDLWGAESR